MLTAGDSPREQRLKINNRPSQRAIGQALRHRGHRDHRQEHICQGHQPDGEIDQVTQGIGNP